LNERETLVKYLNDVLSGAATIDLKVTWYDDEGLIVDSLVYSLVKFSCYSSSDFIGSVFVWA